jgi:Na+-transporting methylmalonyl-CoA/oxaloacetate decarboxylase gamma subunit
MTLTILPPAQAGITALLGYAVVFLGLVLLMIVVTVMGKLFVAAANRKAPKAEKVSTPAAVTPAPEAPGSAGGVKLHNVDPKIAAILMAIVADKLQKPLNELRFISIKEVEQK